VDDLLRADEARRSTLQAFEALRAEQKQLSNQVRTAKGEERDRVLARTKELAAQVKQAEAASNEAERTLRAVCRRSDAQEHRQWLPGRSGSPPL